MIAKYIEFIKLLESKIEVSLHPKAVINTNLFIKNNTDDDNYNCAAYALGFNDKWVGHNVGRYWIDNIPKSNSINNLILLFKYFGFEESNDSIEDGYRKIVIYGNHGIAKHVAIQLDKIWYESKMGESEICTHTLDSIEGALYGYPKIWMKKYD